jgi:hypothetical protein
MTLDESNGDGTMIRETINAADTYIDTQISPLANAEQG